MARKSKPVRGVDRNSWFALIAGMALMAIAYIIEIAVNYPLYAALLALTSVIGTCVFLLLRLAHLETVRLALVEIEDIDNMGDTDFEHYIAVLFRRKGFEASVTKRQGDYGADVIVVDDQNNRIAVQVKHYKHNVGPGAVQEVVTSKEFYNCSKAMVITNAKAYTKSAVVLAASNKGELWARERLIEEVRQVRMSESDTPFLVGAQLIRGVVRNRLSRFLSVLATRLTRL